MGRLTELMDFYTMSPVRSETWMRQNYSHFEPTSADYEFRKQYQKEFVKIEKPKKVRKTKARPKDIFA